MLLLFSRILGLFQADGLDHLLAALTDDQEGGALVACFQGDAVGSAGSVHVLAGNDLTQAVHERDRCTACANGVERSGDCTVFNGEVDVLGDGRCHNSVTVVGTIAVAAAGLATVAAGWGSGVAACRCHRFAVGVDRLTMLLLGLPSLKETQFLFRGPNRLNP